MAEVVVLQQTDLSKSKQCIDAAMDGMQSGEAGASV